MTPSVLWLIAGVILCAAEVVIGPGIGLFFAGLAALCVGMLVEGGAVDAANHLAQFAWFFALTVAWAAVLWKPLQRFRSKTKSGGYRHMIGETAVVAGEGLIKGREGQVTWSGTIMKAELSADAAESVAAGMKVTIVDMQGAKLIVR